MIKLFSLNHTRSEDLKSAQDKNSILDESLTWYFLSKYPSQRPHELLGQFFKERLSRGSIRKRIIRYFAVLSTAYFEKPQKHFLLNSPTQPAGTA